MSDFPERIFDPPALDVVGSLPRDDDDPPIFLDDEESIDWPEDGDVFGAGLCEAEACWGDEWGPLRAPGRIGRRQGRHWRCVGTGRSWTPWRWLWRRRVERRRIVATVTAETPDAATLAALNALAVRVSELAPARLREEGGGVSKP